jgi:hypothetical protein
MYKSIAFLNILNKVLKLVIAWRINDLTKTHDLFFVNQMNERKNRNCETILKLLTKQIHTIWNMSKNKITTLLSMNVIEAYDHVSREKTLQISKKDEFRRESLFEQTISCKTKKSILSWKRDKRL